jgi:hypothetical protein
MTWAADRRLDYVDWRLLVHGEVQRDDISRTFGVSLSQASADIQAFLAAHPRAADYDKSRKRYVPANGRYVSQRGWTPSVLRALSVLAKRGHPMGWYD